VAPTFTANTCWGCRTLGFGFSKRAGFDSSSLDPSPNLSPLLLDSFSFDVRAIELPSAVPGLAQE